MSLRRRLAAVDGQTASEYMGMLLVIATTIFALVSIHVDRTIAHEIERLICQVSEEQCDAKKPRARELTPAQRRLVRLDRDRDGLSNRAERRLGTNPNRADSDGDGLSDGRERDLRLNPTAADTDDDGLPDGVEVRDALRRTSPNDADTDDDGLTDGEELAIGTNPSRRDSDFGDPDGLTDAQEIALGTDPNVLDTDGDGDPDGAEFREGHDPLKDERSIFGKARDFILDHPVDLAVGGVGGAGRNLAGRYVERFLSRTGRLRRIGSAGSREEAAAIRHERLDAFRQRMAEARARAREERGEVELPGGRAGGEAAASIRGRVNAAGLPNEGRIRYVPPERYDARASLPRGPSNGYLDRFGNEWVKGPSRTPGDAYEWDVQLSSRGRAQLGWLSRDQRHVNVSPRGEVTHR